MNERVVTKVLAEKFRAYLYEEEKSENTIEKYLRDVRFFAENAAIKNCIKAMFWNTSIHCAKDTRRGA